MAPRSCADNLSATGGEAYQIIQSDGTHDQLRAVSLVTEVGHSTNQEVSQRRTNINFHILSDDVYQWKHRETRECLIGEVILKI